MSQARCSGGSEYDIHMAYLHALQTTDDELPYPGIVALNNHGAVLHYHGREKKAGGQVLLIDSGATFNNYASDITRTYAQSGCDAVFLELLAETEKMQQELCAAIKSGLYYPSLHDTCHLKIAAILEKTGILNTGGDHEMAVRSGLTKTFFPHGLGHMLGVQVHDIGGKQLDEQGNPAPANPPNILYRSLRFVGTLEPGVIVTIEPGIYFIPTLLQKLKEGNKNAELINWSIIERLLPFGGIRIEDDVLTTQSSSVNLTRKYLT